MEFCWMTAEERVEAVRALWQEGLTRGEIAARLRTTPGTVSGIKHRAGMKDGRRANHVAKWATAERLAAMRERAPTAYEWRDLWLVASRIAGPPMPGHRVVGALCRHHGINPGRPGKTAVQVAGERRAEQAREAKRLAEAKARADEAAEATRETARPAEARGTPGVMLPPVARSWKAIQGTALMQGQIVQRRDDLLLYNRWRVRQGYPPLAIARATAS